MSPDTTDLHPDGVAPTPDTRSPAAREKEAQRNAAASDYLRRTGAEPSARRVSVPPPPRPTVSPSPPELVSVPDLAPEPPGPAAVGESTMSPAPLTIGGGTEPTSTEPGAGRRTVGTRTRDQYIVESTLPDSLLEWFQGEARRTECAYGELLARLVEAHADDIRAQVEAGTLPSAPSGRRRQVGKGEPTRTLGFGLLQPESERLAEEIARTGMSVAGYVRQVIRVGHQAELNRADADGLTATSRDPVPG